MIIRNHTTNYPTQRRRVRRGIFFYSMSAPTETRRYGARSQSFFPYRSLSFTHRNLQVSAVSRRYGASLRAQNNKLAENISAHSASLRGIQRIGGTIADNHKKRYTRNHNYRKLS